MVNAKNTKRHLLEIKQIFDSLNIKFWLWRGTLLGAFGNRSFIPYDHDIDLAMLAKNWNVSLRQKLEAKGFLCTKGMLPHQKIWGFYLTKYEIQTDLVLQYYYPPDDLYIQLNQRKGIDRQLTAAKLFRKDCFVKFLGQQFRVPDSVEEHLKWIYGKTWRTPLHMAEGPSPRFWKQNYKKISLNKYLEWLREH